eukprot:659466-Hanusia_phi.AAC.1
MCRSAQLLVKASPFPGQPVQASTETLRPAYGQAGSTRSTNPGVSKRGSKLGSAQPSSIITKSESRCAEISKLGAVTLSDWHGPSSNH